MSEIEEQNNDNASVQAFEPEFEEEEQVQMKPKIFLRSIGMLFTGHSTVAILQMNWRVQS